MSKMVSHNQLEEWGGGWGGGGALAIQSKESGKQPVGTGDGTTDNEWAEKMRYCHNEES